MLHRFRGLALLLLLCSLLSVASCVGWNNAGSTSAAVPPAGLRVEQGPEGLHLYWKPVSGASHYTVFWGTEPGHYRSCANSPANAAIIASPSKGELYAFAVTSWNARGESNYSKEVLFVSNDDEHNAPKYLSKGREFMAAGQLQEAQAYLSAAIRLQPGKAEGYQLRASLYEQMREFDLAKTDRSVAEKLFRHKTASLEVRTR